jgi:ABC-2 type transport system ATP-binding protein
MTNGTIRTENLSKQFKKVEALRNLNLTVPDGAVYALIGPNGAGKTTAIKLLMNRLVSCRLHEPLGGDDWRLATC